MRKFVLVILLLVGFTNTNFASSSSAHRSTNITVSVYEHVGSIEVGGVLYDFYGTRPAFIGDNPVIEDVIASSGVIYSFSGYSYFAGLGSPFEYNSWCANIQIDTSNGFVNFDGQVFF